LSLGEFLGVAVHACKMLSLPKDADSSSSPYYYSLQRQRLEADRQVVIGTPEDVLSLLAHRLIHPHTIRILVIDGADDLLHGRFKQDTLKIAQTLDGMETQTILMSTTLTLKGLDEMRTFMRHPVTVLVQEKTPHRWQTVKGVSEFYVDVKTEQWKLDTLCSLEKRFLSSSSSSSGINARRLLVFCNSINKVDWLTRKMRGRKYVVAGMHADLEEDRREMLKDFAVEAIPILITTDLWSLDVDIDNGNGNGKGNAHENGGESLRRIGKPGIVINYDFPTNPSIYISRVELCRRLGEIGLAISLRTMKDEAAFKDVETVLGMEIEELPVDPNTPVLAA